MPGYFDVDIEVGESVYFSAGIEEADPASLAQLFDEEVAMRITKDDSEAVC